jgi:hypothetical protein
MTVEIVTLQVASTPPIQLQVIHLLCADSVHVAAIERGIEECSQCLKPLPKMRLPRCPHGVYKPSPSWSCCSVCHPKAVTGKIKPQIFRDPSTNKYTDTLISRADLTLKQPRRRRKGAFDSHQFEKQGQEFGALAELFGENDEAESAGLFIGSIRGPENPVIARDETPFWILNMETFREFLSLQRNRARAAAILYFFYLCGLSDLAVAERCSGLSEAAAKKQRQRLLEQGTAHFGPESRQNVPLCGG